MRKGPDGVGRWSYGRFVAHKLRVYRVAARVFLRFRSAMHMEGQELQCHSSIRTLNNLLVWLARSRHFWSTRNLTVVNEPLVFLFPCSVSTPKAVSGKERAVYA